jgi:TolB-like protein/DNA-binding winged helix-turn-helix (wHTH) protein/Tfp pilus assembly protein PilF
MPVPVSTSRRIAFGPFEADLHSGELLKNGRRVRLQSQPFQLLTMLLEHPGELVTRKEICQKLWSGDTFVDFDRSLGTAINKIREVLNDSASEPRFVETLPTRGYRFIAPVAPVMDPSAVDHEPPPPQENAPENQTPVLRRVLLAIAMAALLVSGLGAWYFLRPPSIRSIAVLPLVNASDDPGQQYFAYAVADELITNLAQIGSLRVISHTSTSSYSGTHKSAPQIARELGVDALVEGSVVRSGNRVRMTTQLIRADSDSHLWAQTYDLDISDILTVQGKLARDIADKISLYLTPHEKVQLARDRPINPDVALLYFKGSYLLSRMDARQAVDAFQQATDLDPGSAESWAGLADALHTMGVQGHDEAFDRAKEAAKKALEIDPSQAQALMVLGAISFGFDWNPAQSEQYFRDAIASRPNYAMAHALFATTLAHSGKIDDAFREINLATSLDRVSVPIQSFAWHVYFCARRYDEALRVIQQANELDPTFRPVYGRLAHSYEQKGEYQKAIDTRVRGRIAGGESPEKANQDVAGLRTALASGGSRAMWQYELDKIPAEERYSTGPAGLYMRLGNKDAALNALEEGYQRREHYLIMWIIAPEFDALRTEPRFQKILHDLGLS